MKPNDLVLIVQADKTKLKGKVLSIQGQFAKVQLDTIPIKIVTAAQRNLKIYGTL